MQRQKTYTVRLLWDGKERWRVRARSKAEALDEALIGRGELLSGSRGYDLEEYEVEGVEA
jgi:hypothetical protein